MALSLFRKKPSDGAVYAVYAAMVGRARNPRFYAQWGVPDTVTGRFDMISLHLALLFRRLRGESGGAREFSQALFDLFFRDMDRSLREMGAGDLAVPKKIRNMGNLFYGLLASLDTALTSNEQGAVEAVLVRNLFGGELTGDPAALALYVRDEASRLAAYPAEEIIGGRLELEAAA